MAERRFEPARCRLTGGARGGGAEEGGDGADAGGGGGGAGGASGGEGEPAEARTVAWWARL